MNPKERLLAILRREPVDRPAFVCPGGMMNMAVTEVMDAIGEAWPDAHSDAAGMARLSAGMLELGGIENLGAPFCVTVEAEGMGAPVVMGSRETEPRVTAYVMHDLDELERITVLDPDAGRAAACIGAIRMMADGYPHVPVIAGLTGPISLATSLVDPLRFYRALRTGKVAAHALLERCAGAAIEFGDAMVGAGASVVCVADPSGTGELIGGTAFEEFALPYINEIVDHFAAAGVPSIVHICGDVRSLVNALPRISAPVISVDSIVPIRTLRALAPEHLTMGNVSTYVLEYGTPETLTTVARSRIDAGVDIVAPACGIGARTPLRNIRAVADTVRGAGDRVGASR
jgi:MtaA/CmuA family methyltransferase